MSSAVFLIRNKYMDSNSLSEIPTDCLIEPMEFLFLASKSFAYRTGSNFESRTRRGRKNLKNLLN